MKNTLTLIILILVCTICVQAKDKPEKDLMEVFGVVDKKGKTIIPFDYLDITPLVYCNLYSAKKIGRGWGAIDTLGNEVIPFVYNQSILLYPQYALISQGIEKWGVIDHTGKEILPATYSHLMYFTTDLLLMKEQNDDLYSVINLQGEVLIPPIYDYITRYTDSLFIVKDDDRYGMVDISNTTILPIEYEYIKIQGYEGLAVAHGEGLNDVIVDRKGELITDWSSVDYANKSVVIVKKDNGYAIINRNDTSLCSPTYRNIYDDSNTGLFQAQNEDGRWALLGAEGKPLTPFIYNDIKVFYTNEGVLYMVEKDDKYGAVDENGKSLIEPLIDYEIISGISPSLFVVESKDGYDVGVINEKGKIILPFDYATISTTTTYRTQSNYWRHIRLHEVSATSFSILGTYLPANWVMARKDDQLRLIDAKRKKRKLSFISQINSCTTDNRFVVGKMVERR